MKADHDHHSDMIIVVLRRIIAVTLIIVSS